MAAKQSPAELSRTPIPLHPFLSLLRKAATPMNDEELGEFQSQLAYGRNRSAPAVSSSVKKSHSDHKKFHESISNQQITDSGFVIQIRNWISDTLIEHIVRSPREHANFAVDEFLNPPCTAIELVGFFRAFAAAYEQVLHVRADFVTSGSCSVDSPHPLTLAKANEFHERTKLLLARLSALETSSPADADLFRLSEFSGCTPAELGLYLNQNPDMIADRIENHRFSIYHEEISG